MAAKKDMGAAYRKAHPELKFDKKTGAYKGKNKAARAIARAKALVPKKSAAKKGATKAKRKSKGVASGSSRRYGYKQERGNHWPKGGAGRKKGVARGGGRKFGAAAKSKGKGASARSAGGRS